MTVKELINELSKHKDNLEVEFQVDLPDSSTSDCNLVGVYDTKRITYKGKKPHRTRFSVTFALADARNTDV